MRNLTRKRTGDNGQTLGHDSDYKNIGSALHELAIRQSFERGLNGRVKLQAAYGSDPFHYKSGYRYIEYAFDFFGRKAVSFSDMCEKYFRAAKAERNGEVMTEDAANLLAQIEAHPLYESEDGIRCYREMLGLDDVYSIMEYLMDKNMSMERFLNGTNKIFHREGGMMSLCEEVRLKWQTIIEAENKVTG